MTPSPETPESKASSLATSPRSFSASDYIPIAHWSKDHWSTLAYIETVLVDTGAFQVGADARMRSNRRNFRVMAQEAPKPKRVTASATGIVMSPEHTTRIKDGSTTNHDDWCCVQDLAHEGLLSVGPENIEPGVQLHLSDRGRAMADALRAHKAAGGVFAAFVPPAQPQPPPLSRHPVP